MSRYVRSDDGKFNGSLPAPVKAPQPAMQVPQPALPAEDPNDPSVRAMLARLKARLEKEAAELEARQAQPVTAIPDVVDFEAAANEDVFISETTFNAGADDEYIYIEREGLPYLGIVRLLDGEVPSWTVLLETNADDGGEGDEMAGAEFTTREAAVKWVRTQIAKRAHQVMRYVQKYRRGEATAARADREDKIARATGWVSSSTTSKGKLHASIDYKARTAEIDQDRHGYLVTIMEEYGPRQYRTLHSLRMATLLDATDFAEEVARMIGYDKIPSVLPPRPLHASLTPTQKRRRAVAAMLAGRGLAEVQTFPFTNQETIDSMGFVGERAKASPIITAGLIAGFRLTAYSVAGWTRWWNGRVA